MPDNGASQGTIQKVGVVGCGLMGSGIVQVSAVAGRQVLVHEADATALEKGLGRIRGSLEKLCSKEKISAELRDRSLASIHTAETLEELSDCDLIVEAVVEDLAVKLDLFGKLGRIAGPRAILASNTSSYPITELAAACGRPDRTVGLHFFNPVPLMKLVEVVKTGETDDSVVQTVREFARSLDKTPIEASDTPGFVVNRLLVPYMLEAIRMLERGDATKEDIDTGMMLGCGHPMGPLTLMDYVGLDTCLFIAEGWHERFPENPLFDPPELLRQKVAAGELGRKTGLGIYRWEGDKKA